MNVSRKAGGVYIHVPFCRKKCPYCDFYSIPERPKMAEEYTAALLKEADLRSAEAAAQTRTLYVGGGTPSRLSPSQLEILIQRFVTPSTVELTVEVNPDDVSTTLLEAYASMGINRLSMGVQSLDDAGLHAISRTHDAVTALKAIDAIEGSRISNYSIDLMYGLPGQSLDAWQKTLEAALAISPPHLSAYLLSYEPGTRFGAMLAAGKASPASDETATAMYKLLCRLASDAGYEHYEISNFCKPQMQSRHNSAYWTGVPYLGLGPSAHSFDGACTRRANPRNLKLWQQQVMQGQTAYEEEVEDEDSLFNDRVMTGLRTRNGFAFSPAEKEEVMRQSAPYLSTGEMYIAENGNLAVAESHWLLCDSYISSLFRV